MEPSIQQRKQPETPSAHTNHHITITTAPQSFGDMQRLSLGGQLSWIQSLHSFGCGRGCWSNLQLAFGARRRGKGQTLGSGTHASCQQQTSNSASGVHHKCISCPSPNKKYGKTEPRKDTNLMEDTAPPSLHHIMRSGQVVRIPDCRAEGSLLVALDSPVPVRLFHPATKHTVRELTRLLWSVLLTSNCSAVLSRHPVAHSHLFWVFNNTV